MPPGVNGWVECPRQTPLGETARTDTFSECGIAVPVGKPGVGAVLVFVVGCLFGTALHWRRRDDPVRRREQVLATLRQMAASAPGHVHGSTEPTPDLSDNVRILSERPPDVPRRRHQPARRAPSRAARRRTAATAELKTVVIPTPPSPGGTTTLN
jgi:hypothetical protein